jgi:hypothetical protein
MPMPLDCGKSLSEPETERQIKSYPLNRSRRERLRLPEYGFSVFERRDDPLPNSRG